MAVNKGLEEEDETSKPANQDESHSTKLNISNEKKSTTDAKISATKEEIENSNDSDNKTLFPKSFVFGFNLEDIMENLDSSSFKTNFRMSDLAVDTSKVSNIESKLQNLIQKGNTKVILAPKSSDIEPKINSIFQKGNAKAFYMSAFKRYLFHLRHAFSNVPAFNLLDLHENKKWEEFFKSIENEEDLKPILAYLSTNELKVVKCLIDSGHLPKRNDNGLSKSICLLRKMICEDCSAKGVNCKADTALVNENKDLTKTSNLKFESKTDYNLSKDLQELRYNDDIDSNLSDGSEIFISETEEIVVEYMKQFKKGEKVSDESVKEEIYTFLNHYKDHKNNITIFNSLRDVAQDYFVQLKKIVNKEFNTLRQLNIVMDSIKTFKETISANVKNEANIKNYSGWVIEDYTVNSEPKVQLLKISQLSEEATRKVKKQSSKVHNKIGKSKSRNPKINPFSKAKKGKDSEESNKQFVSSEDLDPSKKRYRNVCQNIENLKKTYWPIFESHKRKKDECSSEISPTSKSDLPTQNSIDLLSSLANSEEVSENDKNNNQEQNSFIDNKNSFEISQNKIDQKSSERLQHGNHNSNLKIETESLNVTDEENEVFLKNLKNSTNQENDNSTNELIYEFTGNKDAPTMQMYLNSKRQNLKNSKEVNGDTNQVKPVKKTKYVDPNVPETGKSQKLTSSETTMKFGEKYSEPKEKDNGINKTIIPAKWQNELLNGRDKPTSLSDGTFLYENKTDSVSKIQVPKPIEVSKNTGSPSRKKLKLQPTNQKNDSRSKMSKSNNGKKSGRTQNMQKEACLLQEQSGKTTNQTDNRYSYSMPEHNHSSQLQNRKTQVFTKLATVFDSSTIQDSMMKCLAEKKDINSMEKETIPFVENDIYSGAWGQETEGSLHLSDSSTCDENDTSSDEDCIPRGDITFHEISKLYIEGSPIYKYGNMIYIQICKQVKESSKNMGKTCSDCTCDYIVNTLRYTFMIMNSLFLKDIRYHPPKGTILELFMNSIYRHLKIGGNIDPYNETQGIEDSVINSFSNSNSGKKLELILSFFVQLNVIHYSKKSCKSRMVIIELDTSLDENPEVWYDHVIKLVAFFAQNLDESSATEDCERQVYGYLKRIRNLERDTLLDLLENKFLESKGDNIFLVNIFRNYLKKMKIASLFKALNEEILLRKILAAANFTKPCCAMPIPTAVYQNGTAQFYVSTTANGRIISNPTYCSNIFPCLHNNISSDIHESNGISKEESFNKNHLIIHHHSNFTTNIFKKRKSRKSNARYLKNTHTNLPPKSRKSFKEYSLPSGAFFCVEESKYTNYMNNLDEKQGSETLATEKNSEFDKSRLELQTSSSGITSITDSSSDVSLEDSKKLKTPKKASEEESIQSSKTPSTTGSPKASSIVSTDSTASHDSTKSNYSIDFTDVNDSQEEPSNLLKFTALTMHLVDTKEKLMDNTNESKKKKTTQDDKSQEDETEEIMHEDNSISSLESKELYEKFISSKLDSSIAEDEHSSCKPSTKVDPKDKESEALEETISTTSPATEEIKNVINKDEEKSTEESQSDEPVPTSFSLLVTTNEQQSNKTDESIVSKPNQILNNENEVLEKPFPTKLDHKKTKNRKTANGKSDAPELVSKPVEEKLSPAVLNVVQPQLETQIPNEETNNVLDAKALVTTRKENKIEEDNSFQKVSKKKSKIKKKQLIYSNTKPQQFYHNLNSFSGSSKVPTETNVKSDTTRSDETIKNVDNSKAMNARNKITKVLCSDENQQQNKIKQGKKADGSFIRKEILLDFGVKLNDIDQEKRNKRSDDVKLFQDITIVDVKLGPFIMKPNEKNDEPHPKENKHVEASKYAAVAGKSLHKFMNIAEDFPKCEDTMSKNQRSASKSKNGDKTRTSSKDKKDDHNADEKTNCDAETENNPINDDDNVRSTELEKNIEVKSDVVLDAELLLVNINGCPTSSQIFENLPAQEPSDDIAQPKHPVTELDNLENQELEIFVESNKGKTAIKTIPSDTAESSKTSVCQTEDNSKTPDTSISDKTNVDTFQSKRSKRRKSKTFKQESHSEKKSPGKNIVTSDISSTNLKKQKSELEEKQLKVVNEDERGVEADKKDNRSLLEDIPSGVCPDVTTQQLEANVERPINISEEDLKLDHEEEIVEIIKQENKAHKEDLSSITNDSQVDWKSSGTNIKSPKSIPEEDILKLRDKQPENKILQENENLFVDNLSSNLNHSQVDSIPSETVVENCTIVCQEDNKLKVDNEKYTGETPRQEDQSFIKDFSSTTCSSPIEPKLLETNSEQSKITPEEGETLKDEEPLVESVQQDNKPCLTTNNSQVVSSEIIVEQSKNEPVIEKTPQPKYEKQTEILKRNYPLPVNDVLFAENPSQVESKHIEKKELQIESPEEIKEQKPPQRKRRNNKKRKSDKSLVGDVSASTEHPEEVTKTLNVQTGLQKSAPMGSKKIQLEEQEKTTEIVADNNICPSADIFADMNSRGDVTKALEDQSSGSNKYKTLDMEQGVLEKEKEDNKSSTIDISSINNSKLQNIILEVNEKNMSPVVRTNLKQQKDTPKNKKEVTVEQEPQTSKIIEEKDTSTLRSTFELGNHPKFIANLLNPTSELPEDNPEKVSLMQLKQEEPNGKTNTENVETKLEIPKQTLKSQKKNGGSKIKKLPKKTYSKINNIPDNVEVLSKSNRLGENLEKILDSIAETCYRQLNDNKLTESKGFVQNEDAKNAIEQSKEKLNVFCDKTQQASSESVQGDQEINHFGKEQIQETGEPISKLKQSQVTPVDTYSSIDDAIAHPKVNTYKLSDVKQTEDLYKVGDSKSLQINLKAKVEDDQEVLLVNKNKELDLPIEVQESLKTLARFYMNNYTNSLTTADFFLNNSRLQILIVSKTNELDTVEEMEVDECLPSNVQENTSLENKPDVQKKGSGETDLITFTEEGSNQIPDNQDECAQKVLEKNITIEKPSVLPKLNPESGSEMGTSEKSPDLDTKQQLDNKPKASVEKIDSSASTTTPPSIPANFLDVNFELPAQPATNDFVNEQDLDKSLETNINSHLLNEIHEINELKNSLNNPSIKAMLHVMDAIQNGLDKPSNKSDNETVQPHKYHEVYRITKDGLVSLSNPSEQKPFNSMRILKQHEKIPEENFCNGVSSSNEEQDLENDANIKTKEQKGKEYLQGQGRTKHHKTPTKNSSETNTHSSGTKSQQKSNKSPSSNKNKKRKR